MNTNPLGKNIAIPTQLSPELLFAIPRSEARKRSGVNMSFIGQDIWNCYELSWLDLTDKPVSSVCRIGYDCHSRSIVESKSLKLYLCSFNQTHFTDAASIQKAIERDLSAILDTPSLRVEVISSLDDQRLSLTQPAGICIDSLTPAAVSLGPDAKLLKTCSDRGDVSETLNSNIFRSLCPVTSQPDWATVTIQYHGPKIYAENLLAYLISYRTHQGFHEDCCERIFSDIMEICTPKSLSIMCNFLRRGGIDINPIRSTSNAIPLEYKRVPNQ